MKRDAHEIKRLAHLVCDASITQRRNRHSSMNRIATPIRPSDHRIHCLWAESAYPGSIGFEGRRGPERSNERRSRGSRQARGVTEIVREFPNARKNQAPWLQARLIELREKEKEAEEAAARKEKTP